MTSGRGALQLQRHEEAEAIWQQLLLARTMR